jgi:MFS family permease
LDRIKLKDSLSPLRQRSFLILWIGQSVSSIGNAFILVALAFAVLHVGGDAVDVGVVAAIQIAARIIFALAGGVWGDRLRRQYVMLTSDILRAAVEAVLAGLLISGHCRVWEIAVGVSIFGAATAFFQPAATGLIPEVATADTLTQANALMSLSRSTLQTISPAVSGVLIAAFGPGWAFAADSASFIVSAVSLAMLRLPPKQRSERASFLSDLASGWHEVAARSWLWLNLCAHASYNFAISGYAILGPVICAQRLGGAAAWGIISTSWGLGAVVGGIIGMRRAADRPLVVSNVGGALGILTLIALAVLPPTWLICVAAVVSGVGLALLNIYWTTTVQQLVQQDMLSRVNSYDWLISLVAQPAGFALIGVIAARIGDRATLIGAAAVLGIPCLLVMLAPTVRNVSPMRKAATDETDSMDKTELHQEKT